MRHFSYSLKYVIWLTVSILLVTCRSVQKSPAQSVTGDTDTSHVFEEPKVSDSLQHDVYADLRRTDTVFDFYKRTDFKIYWTENGASRASAKSLMEMITLARRYGLLPQHYHAREIATLTSQNLSKNDVIRFDVVLTDAFFALLNDLKSGRIKLQASAQDTTGLFFLQQHQDPDIKSFLESQEPLYTGYQSLKYALNTILDTLNDAHRNLLMTGITLDSLEAHRKVRLLEINMDRWREENQIAGDPYVWINIPSFSLRVVEKDKDVFNSRIIVGAAVTPTPEFSSDIECITVFPYWYLPRKIAVNEYLPVIKKDTTFITRNNFDVLDKKGNIVPLGTIDWSRYGATNFPFTLRQREGRENALGIIKFIFDNPYAVYVHDTNGKNLFNKKVRALSHGCIRLEKAVEFAHYLIRDKRAVVTSEKLNHYLKAEKRVNISLLKSVPIHIRYFTAEVKDGMPKFHPDIYKKDNARIGKIYHEMLDEKQSL